MVAIRKVEDLRVYQTAMRLLARIYDIAYKIPHLKFRTQLINSTEAVAPLIAEGFAKQRNNKESARFYEMAMTESDESTAHLRKAIILSKRFPRIPVKECEFLIEEYQSLSRQLNKLAQTWRNFS